MWPGTNRKPALLVSLAEMDAGGGTAQLARDRWADAATWSGDGIAREVFFFRSGAVDLYGSVYAAERPLPLGVVICNSWGYEANLASRIVHPVSIGVAQAGGVALSFHYPGFGDSEGDFAATTIDAMAHAAQDAVREASRRHPATRWVLVGLMFGASIAAIATAREPGIDRLLLVQPALRPGAYFGRLARVAKRSLGPPAPEPAPGYAFGYRLTPELVESAPAADAVVEAALAGFSGEGAVVSCETPEEIVGAPERFECIRTRGSWRIGVRDMRELTAATVAWLVGRLAEEAA
jgi:hypothetical protein